MQRGRPVRTLLLGVLVPASVLATGCTPSRPPSRPDPTPLDTGTLAAEPSLSGPWRFAHADGVHRFEFRSSAIVEALDAGTTDTVELAAHLTYVIDRSADTTSILGTVDSFSVHGSVPPVSSSVVLPIPFRLARDSAGGVQEIVSPDTSSCGSPAGALLMIARDLLVSVPHEVGIGHQWTDTLVATSCRGDIPMTLRSMRSSVVTRASSANGLTFLHIRRESATGVSGTGTRRIQSTTVTGSGHGWSELMLDPVSGRFLGGRGESTLELTFDAASRRVRFRQHVRQQIRRL